MYIEDDVFQAVYRAADEPTRDAMDLAYLTADTLRFNEGDIADGELTVRQGKTGKKLRIAIEGELDSLVRRIQARKSRYRIASTALIVNESGARLTVDALRARFEKARAKAGVPFVKFQFRDLRAKAGTDKTDTLATSGRRKSSLASVHHDDGALCAKPARG